MADSGQLLRMLEPAVRPVAVPEGRGAAPAKLPVEQQSFESLLAAARSGEAGEAVPLEGGALDHAMGQGGQEGNLLGPLSQVGAIENTSLRALVERHNGTRE